MRYRLGLSVACAALLLAGCAKPGGVDGNLTNGWSPMSAPTGFAPGSETCHLANFATVGPRDTYEEIDCRLKHRTETVHVGRYRDPAAEADAPPAAGTAGAREAYRICDQKTTGYVGGPWRAARLWVGVTRPTPEAWTGGARWFRCEVLEISSIEDDGGLVMRAGSLRNVLRETDPPLRLDCYAIGMKADGGIATMPPAPCAAGHNAEFVGIWNADDFPYPKRDKQWVPFHNGCRELIAAYVGVPDDPDLPFRTGVVSLPGGEDVWAQGDRGVRCYLWVDGGTLTSSLRDKGAKALPVRYE
jgi:hypothetical protein